MAYVNKGSNGNRAATGVVVALIQGAAVYALVAGLAVTFMPAERKPRLTGEQIKLPPLPSTDEPETKQPPIADPTIDRTVIRDPAPINDSVETTTSTITTTTNTVDGGSSGSGGTGTLETKPDPKPAFPPRTPMPRNKPGTWATPADYPAADLRAENQGTTRFHLQIGSDGKVLGCEIVGTSGFPSLDAATCRMVSRRARFDPATDAGGAPVLGTYTSAVRWEIPRD